MIKTVTYKQEIPYLKDLTLAQLRDLVTCSADLPGDSKVVYKGYSSSEGYGGDYITHDGYIEVSGTLK